MSENTQGLSAEERAEAEKDAHARELRKRNAKLMEPDDDLRMPVGQKVVLAVVFVAVVAIVCVMLFTH